MTDAELRGELEAVYNAAVQALKDRDAEAFLAAMLVSDEQAEGLRASFAEAAASILESTPELSQMTFVAVQNVRDELAGHYAIIQDPHFANVLLTTFLKVGERWRIVSDAKSYSFEPEPGQDVVARAKELIETEAALQLTPPILPGAEPEAVGWTMDVQALIRCMADGYGLELAVNGTPLSFRGGQSYAGLLLGVAPGAEPADPAVLQQGENQIDVEYHRTSGEAGSQLTVEILALPDRPLFRLVSAKPDGKVSAAFRIPASDSEEILPVVIEDEAEPSATSPEPAPGEPAKYTVYVDDNFHHGDEEERYKLGDFDTAAEALAASKKIVDEFLNQGYKPGMSFEELYEGYTGFGEDPFIVSDDPDCKFHAWDYAKERCRELCSQGQADTAAAAEAPPSEGQATEDLALRAELEAVYAAMRDALQNKDLEAFLAAMAVRKEPSDAERAQFPEMADMLLEIMPDLAGTTFVTVKTLGDDLAGHYSFVQDPNFVNISLTRFIRVEGRWKVFPESSSYSFTPQEGEDVMAKVREHIETETSMRLETPPEPEGPPQAAEWNPDVRVALDCMAYGYEVKIAVNGAALRFTGGHSFSGMLFGVAPSAEPAEPGVLQIGENQIEVEYRKTNEEMANSLTVGIRVLPDRRCIQFETAAIPQGSFRASFIVQASGTQDAQSLESGNGG
jgi:hypothetical protein